MRDRSITRSAVLHASIANLIILGLWAWWVRITILQLMMPRLNFSWIVKPPLPYAIRLTLEAWFPWEIGVSRFIVAAFAAGLIAWAVYKWRERASLPAFIVIAAPIIFFVASQSTPIYVPRTIFWMSAPFFLLVAAGLCALPTRQAIQIAVAIALSISAVNYALWLRTSFGDPWAEVVRSIERVDPDGLVLVEGRGAGLALERYCEISRCKLQIATLRTTKDERWTSGFAPKIDVNPEEALSMLRSGGRAIFVNWLGIPPQTLIGQVHILKRIEVPGLSDGVVVSLIEADGAVSSAIAGSTR
ncbi:MAG: hypothetical protein JWN07_2508 [Hyphomicrobiales bacterium]|nr:hypothetical protein [Hyphomicrobiales bacterium]